VKRFLGVAIAIATLGAVSHARAEPSEEISKELRIWSGSNALTVPRGRWEFGLFGASHYGLSDSVELSLHPLLVFALPHLEAKRMMPQGKRSALGLRARASYPTTFLDIVSKEGQFGLLPATSDPPAAFQLDGDVILSSEWFDGELASVWLGGTVALHESFTPMELPLLDFPFLYQRFAALYGPGVLRIGFSFEGVIAGGLHYGTELESYLMPDLPDVSNASAIENGLELEYRFSDHVALSAGLRTSYAKYPYGRRTHFLPYADVRTGF
jgi:hypothetical protein